MGSTWLVRADSGGRLAPEFKSRAIVAIGWIEAGNTLDLVTREDFSQRMAEAYPEDSKPKQRSAAGQVFRFVREVQVGDQVVTYDSARRIYLVGRIASAARYDATLFEGEFPTYRQIEWLHEVARDDLTVKAKNSLGSTLTLFKVSAEIYREFEALTGGGKPQQASEEDEGLEEEDLLQDLQARSLEFIKDRVSKLDWEQMQDLTAGLLRAMGYKTRVSPSGPDRGKDIVASPDGFGFEQPRIIVEVKHRRGQMGTKEVRGFLAVIRHPGDKGLYVSTGGFSREAYYEAERANNPITLMNLDDLVEAILEHYEAMDLETRVLLPLKRVYWPA
ncbi:restriction endonuclease [Chromobacterium sp. ASV23]|uniref:restriction endonuclease n=1 Tax=Chromobacterium sp. ASV23 TaxID=2795110 RepID=UPI0018ED67A7|nr:restriction endonuclease [Chromobacterium sp. ASV23]